MPRGGSPPSARLKSGAATVLLLLFLLARTAAAARVKRVASPLSDCGGGVTVLRSAAWPGNGAQITFAVSDSAAALRTLPTVRINGVSAAVAPAPQKAGFTAVLIVPAAGQLDTQCLAVQALLESLPLQERTGIWYAPASGNVSLVADFTDNKGHLIARLAELRLLLGKAFDVASDDAASAAMDSVLAALKRTDSTAEGPVSRSLVIAARAAFRSAPAPTGSVDATPVAISPVLWLVGAAGSAAADARSGTVGWRGSGDRSAVLNAGRVLAGTIAARRAATFRAAACFSATVEQDRLRVEIKSQQAEATCSVSGDSRADVAAAAYDGAQCNADDAAADAYPYPDTVTLSFTAEEDAVFEHHRAFYKGSDADLELDKAGMNLSVVFGSGSPIPSRAHFRGVSSFRDCPLRKSLAVKLSGPRERRLQPGSATDHFFLISMCADDRYVKTQAANTMARAIGVYRVPQRYVRVLLAHANATIESLGIYLLMEDPDVTFAKEASALASVVRRRNDPTRLTDPDKGTPTVQLPKDAAAAADALARYDSIVQISSNCTESACYGALAQLFDVDMYLRWVAFATFVGLGDYIDEVFFYTSSELAGRWYWSINAWDTDDSFEYDATNNAGYGCHHSGLDAQYDPHGLLFCSEATFDRVLVRSPDMYARYADHLQYLLRQGLSSSFVAGLMNRQLADLFGLVSDDQTASGLLELIANDPAAATASGARSDISDAIAYYTGWLEERRAYLLHQLRIYRERTGRPAAPVPMVDGVGDFIPGAILSAVPPSAAKTAVRARSTRAAPPNAPLHTACAALKDGELNVTLEVRCVGYTAACQELVLAPRIRVNGDTAVSLAGLRLSVAFDRVVTDPSLPDPEPMVEAASDWDVRCYSGGSVAERAGTAPPDDACTQLGVRTTVLDDRIELALTSGTLCAGCALDLGVDDALASVWHARWLPLSKPAKYVALPPAASCPSLEEQPVAQTAMPAAAANAAAPVPEPPTPPVAATMQAVQAATPTAAPVAVTVLAAAPPVATAAPVAAAKASAPVAQAAMPAPVAAAKAAAPVAQAAMPAPVAASKAAAPTAEQTRITPVTAPGVFTPPLPPPAGLLGWLFQQPSHPPPPAGASQQILPPPNAPPQQCAAWQLLFGCTQRPAAG